jgi:hypothetical protein
VKYIRRGKAVEEKYDLTDRQQKRLVVERRISHFHPNGDNGPCYLAVAELDALFELSAKPAIRRTKGNAS